MRIKGNMPVEGWADIFRCFVSPAARLSLKKLRLGIDFDLEMQAPLDASHATLKALREAARPRPLGPSPKFKSFFCWPLVVGFGNSQGVTQAFNPGE